MRIVFFGTPAFAVPSLEALLDGGVDVAAAVTQPDRPRGRSHSTLTPPPVKQCAIARGVPVLQPERPRGDEFMASIRALRADVGVVVAYGHLLRPDLLTIPRLGMVNVHASLLPRWRGAAPIHWAVLSGDRETGVSIMRVEEGLDSGAVWHMARTPIDRVDTTGVLLPRLAALGATALLEALPRIAGGEEPVPQRGAGVTHAPKVDRATAHIDWTSSAATIARLVNAMDPAPGAWTTCGDTEIKFFGAAVGPDVFISDDAGAVDPTSAGPMRVSTAGGTLQIREVQPAGRRRMDAHDWMRGSAIADGARFR